ncbi:MAG: hypothetical protein DSN99_08530 [Archaeoglobi archaeon]|nr:MAG: hypothetical protein DSN99_08530 [Archaeoglobi archaeon]
MEGSSMVIIGVPISPQTEYLLEKFLKNQKEIQEKTRVDVKTVFATEDEQFAKKLRTCCKEYGINCEVILFEAKRPLNAKNRIWNIVAARNAIRDYFLNSNAEYLVFIDSDMIFDPDILNKLIEKVKKGYDVVYNGYLDKDGLGINLTGFGGTLIKRRVMEKIVFRCKENNGRVIDEAVFFEIDLFKMGAKVFRSFLAYNEHHGKTTAICHPRELKLTEKIRNSPYFRVPIHMISATLGYDLLRGIKNAIIKLKKFTL